MSELKFCVCGARPVCTYENGLCYVACFACKLSCLSASDEERAEKNWNEMIGNLEQRTPEREGKTVVVERLHINPDVAMHVGAGLMLDKINEIIDVINRGRSL